MRFFVAALGFFILSFIPTSSYAKCGINSISTRRCEGGGWKTVVRCHDRVERTINEPNACIAERRYSGDPSIRRSFCENRCNPAILDCSEAPSLDNLMRAICEKTVECRPDFFQGPYACAEDGSGCGDLHANQMAECMIQLNDSSASDELGLSESQGEITFAVIRNALAERTIHFDGDIYCDCMYRIRNLSSCPDVSDPRFGGGYVEELIPEQCGNDQYPGTLLPDNFNPVTGRVGN